MSMSLQTKRNQTKADPRAGSRQRGVLSGSRSVSPEKQGSSRAAKRGGFRRAVFPIWTRPSFFVLFFCLFLPFFAFFPCFFPFFPLCFPFFFSLFPLFPFSFLFCPFWDFPDFCGIVPICSGMVRGSSRFVPFPLSRPFRRAPTRNSPERVRDTIWTIPEKSGKHPALETPRFSFSQILLGFPGNTPNSQKNAPHCATKEGGRRG